MILGISLNSRTVGLAILAEGSLLDYHIKFFKERYDPVKLRKIVTAIQEYASDYQVQSVSIMLPHLHYCNPATTAILEGIERACNAMQLSCSKYQARMLHSLCEDVRAKKKALMESLTVRYPELSLAQRKELRNQKPYYNKLFEAVGAATLHFNETR